MSPDLECKVFRDRSLITERGTTQQAGGQVKFWGKSSFTPTKNEGGGGGRYFSHAEGASQKVLRYLWDTWVTGFSPRYFPLHMEIYYEV